MAMPAETAAKFEFVLKALSMSRSQLAAGLEVDKSAVGRWLTGAAEPTAHNLSAFTRLVAQRVQGFTILDWELDLPGLATSLGVGSPAAALDHGPLDRLPLPLLEECRATARIRGGAYEGFYRSTRPYAQRPGVFVHDQLILRRESNGLLALRMNTGGVEVVGWALTLQNQLFCVGAELTSGAFVFAIINGVSTVQAGLLDGLILSCALDLGRTPTASVAVFERVAELSGDREADDRRLADLGGLDPVAAEGSISPALREHLVREVGPSQLAQGGDWLLRLPLARSMSRGVQAPW